ncbi:MAG: FMN-binding protein [Acidimicrobiales bacterium]
MRRILVAVASTVCGVVALFSYRTSTMGAAARPSAATAPPGPVPSPTGAAAARPWTGAGSSTGADSPSASPTTPTTAAGGGSASSGGAATTVNGTAVATRWSTVQVQVRVSGGRLVDVAALSLPDSSNRDFSINGRAVPVLRQEALSAQSAKIDTVSGATVTSRGYISSLQAALDAAHLGG